MRPDHGHDLRQRHLTSSFDANVHARLYGSDVGADAAYDRTLDVNVVRRRQRRHFSFLICVKRFVKGTTVLQYRSLSQITRGWLRHSSFSPLGKLCASLWRSLLRPSWPWLTETKNGHESSGLLCQQELA